LQGLTSKREEEILLPAE